MQLAIVTNFEYCAQAIEQILNDQGWQLLIWIGQEQAYEWLLQHQHIDIILIDLNLANAVALLQQLSIALPQIPLVAVATPQRMVELQSAMLAGATAFVAFPFESTQLIATLKRAHRERIRPWSTGTGESTATTAMVSGTTHKQPGKVIVLTSLKGGVGRSTIAANLAVLLRQHTGREVVLLEAHHTLGHLALLLNLYPRHTIKNLEGEVNLDLDLLYGLLQKHNSGLRLLAAPTDPAQLIELPIGMWQQVITLLKTIADYIVVDTAAHADDLLSALLAQANDILLVTGADIAGLRDGRILLQALRNEAPVEGRIHLVLNRAGVRGGIEEGMAQAHLGEPLAIAIPEDNALSTFAFNRGVPFVTSHPHALLSRRLHALMAQVTGAQIRPVEQALGARPSLFSILGFAR